MLPCFNRNRRATACVLLLTLMALAGCQKPTGQGASKGDDLSPSETVVALVNGVPIHADEVDYWYRSAHGAKVTAQMKEKALDHLVERELVFQKGLELGLDDVRYHTRIRGLELQLKALKRSEMMSLVYSQEVAPGIHVSEDDAHAYFEKVHDRFTNRLRLTIWHFQDLKQAHAAIIDLKAGRRAPAEPYDSGPMDWAQIPFEWHDVVYNLKPGEMSDIFEGDKTGIRLFKLISVEPMGPVRFADLKSTIISRLQDHKAKEAFREYVKQLEKDAKIKRSHIE